MWICFLNDVDKDLDILGLGQTLVYSKYPHVLNWFYVSDITCGHHTQSGILLDVRYLTTFLLDQAIVILH